MVRSRLARSLVLAAASVLSGACATTRYTQSRIASPDAPGRGGHAAAFEVGGVRVRVESRDRAARGERAPGFAVRLVFEPDALGYSFDPGQVVLRDADGRVSPTGARGYQPLHPKAAFDLHFDGAVEPGRGAELVVGGLARGTKRLEPVTLRLARADGRSYDRLYWLEAIGFVLTAPLALAGGGM